MLTLSRRVGEVLTIGDDIEVRVVSMQGGKVKLAIEAPREMTIRRQELRHHSSDHSGAAASPR
jgi:carbon storage regulator